MTQGSFLCYYANTYMSFLKNLTAFLPIGKKEQELEYFFAINIGAEILTAALWTIEGHELKILGADAQEYSSQDEIINITDKLLDQVIGLKEIEPQKILFGVPDSWLSGDGLKDEYLKILRSLVKELELTPMAYVATSNAITHFLENQEGVPTTAILVGFEKSHLTVTVARAGKVDGVKVIARGENPGSDIEKALLTFTDVETLPSKILIYGSQASGLRSQLLSFSWMSKLSFLHIPRIEVLDEDVLIKSVCLAGGLEMKDNIKFTETTIGKSPVKSTLLEDTKEEKMPITDQAADNFGFMAGDVTKENQNLNIKSQNDSTQEELEKEEAEETELVVPEVREEVSPSVEVTREKHKRKFKFTYLAILLGLAGTVALLISVFVFLLKANVKIFVEPKVLEKDAQVVADPNQKTVNEDGKIIPGQIVETEVSGSEKSTATGKKQIGDPAKGTIVVYNKTFDSLTLSKGTQITGPGGIKFTLDSSVSIASASATDSGVSFGKPSVNPAVTAVSIGADGNLSSGSNFAIAGYSSDKLTAKSEGNFAGGTSKDVTVVSSEDAQKLLARLSSDLRQQAQQKLQDKYPDKKILAEALSEGTVKKSYNKNIGDQAGEFSLHLTVKFKGTAFDDADLKTIVSKLVNMQVPDGFQLDVAQTETQADVAKLEKNGKLIFLAKFKAKLMPKIDTDKIKSQIKFKTPDQVESMLKGMDNVLGSEIKMTPDLPKFLQRMPIYAKNIQVEVGLK